MTLRPIGSISFGAGAAEGRPRMRDLLGGKGAYLAEMSSLGLPVPPGLHHLDGDVRGLYRGRQEFPNGLKSEVSDALDAIAQAVGATFGDADNPLLVSVRSGSRASMPGMMDTVLNLGLNDVTVGAWREAGDSDSPMTAIAALSRCIPMSCSASTITCSRKSSTITRARRRRARHRSDRRGLGKDRRRV